MTSRRMIAVAAGAAAVVGGLPITAAHADPSKQLERAYQHAYAKADKTGSPGRNIVENGVVSHTGKPRSPKAHEVRESLDVLQRMHGGASSGGGAVAAGGSQASPALQSIAACESGGDPSAVDASGTYRGKYQFDQGTWQSIGGSGDPAAASEATQDAMAAKLYAQRGSSPWPVCGG